MEKVERWNLKFIIIFLLSFFVVLIVNFVLLKKIHLFFAIIYFVFFIFVFVFYFYFKCTRCYYFGRRCYCMGGKVTEMFFRVRNLEKEKAEDIIAFLLLALFFIYPAIVYILPLKKVSEFSATGHWGFLLVHIILTILIFVVHQLIGCSMCKNENCIAYRKK